MNSMGDPGQPSGATNRTGIVTPDAVGLDLQIATLGSRGAAYLLDVSILLVVLFLLLISQALLGAAGFVPGWWGIAVLLLLAFTWQFGYPIGFEVLARGRTPGKAAMGLRVVTVEGAPVGLRHAVVRASVGLLELLGTFGGLAVLSSFASPRSQRLGDMAAGTLVVRERRGGGTPSAEVFRAPAGYESYVARLDVSGLQPSDYAAVRETLRRARDLPPAIREQVTSQLAARLVPRVQPPPPTACSAEAFLACVAAAIQARRARVAPAVPAGPGSRVTGGPRAAWVEPPAAPADASSSEPPSSEPPSSGFTPPA